VHADFAVIVVCSNYVYVCAADEVFANLDARFASSNETSNRHTGAVAKCNGAVNCLDFRVGANGAALAELQIFWA